MKTSNLTNGFLQKICNDERILPSHIALFTAITFYANEKWFRISRRKLMQYSKLKSISTYHRCLRNLVDFGYIRYEPSYDPIKASKISIIKFE